MKILKYRLFNKIIKLFAYLFILFILLNSILGLYIFLNQNEFKFNLLKYANSYQKGQISAEKIALSPFKHFPSISIELADVFYYESDSLYTKSNPDPICHFDRFYIAFDILQLLKGRVRISETTAEDGTINLQLYPDSSLNLSNAIASTDTNSNIIQTNDSNNIVKADLLLKHINFNNIDLRFTNDLQEQKSSFHLNSIKAKLSYAKDSLDCQLVTDLRINGIQKNEKIRFHDVEIKSNLSFTIDLKQKVFNFNPSQLSIQGASFDLEGLFKYGENGDYRFNISGSDHGMSFYRLVLREDIVNNNIGNLKKGEIWFNGKIEGNALNDFVFLEFMFGVKNIRIDINESTEPIDHLHFNGTFTTGRKENYSEARFTLKDVEASLPNGHISGNIEILDFTTPKITMNLSSKIDLEVVEKIFKIDRYLSNLKGQISIESALKGYFDSSKGRLIRNEEKSEIQLDSISFTFPGSGYHVALLDGKIMRTEDNYHLHNIHFISGISDLTINGYLTELVYLIFREKSDINGQLDIRAKRLIIKELIGQNLNRSEILNDTLSQIHLNADINTTTTALLNINKFPECVVNIHELSGKLQTTPDIYQGNGVLKFSDEPRRFNIGFENIDLLSSTGDIKVNGNLFISDSLDQKIEFLTELKNFDIVKTKNELKLINIDYSFLDSLTGNLNTNFNFLINFSADSFEIKNFSLENMNIDYTSEQQADQISALDVDFMLNDIKYDSSNNSLFAYSGSIHSAEILVRNFKLKNMGFVFHKKNNIYRIDPDISMNFGSGKLSEEGLIYIDVSDTIPSYHFNFKILDYKVDNMMKEFARKKIIKGNMNLNLQLTSKGKSLDDLLINLEGEVETNGRDLIFYGVDLDHILKKIQRFQSFNLVDITAYFVAGPLAPLATKGYDVANVITTSLGDKTDVTRLVSNWKIENGVAVIKDAALTTSKNRIAIKGQVDFGKSEYKDITAAVLNRRGCSLISQTINGPFTEPNLGKLDAVGPIRGTLESLLKTITGKECIPFYTGSLPHPD